MIFRHQRLLDRKAVEQMIERQCNIGAKPFGVSTTGRLLQYKGVITPVLHRSTQSVSPQSSVYILRSLPPKKGFESLTLAVSGFRLS